MNTLLYDYNVCHVRRGDQTFSAGIKPVFSFEYEALIYDGATGQYRANGADHELSVSQIAEIETYITSIEADPTEQAIADAHVYLADTDWIMSKITERMVFGTQSEVDALKIKYASEIQLREDARVTINGS